MDTRVKEGIEMLAFTVILFGDYLEPAANGFNKKHHKYKTPNLIHTGQGINGSEHVAGI